MGIGLLTEDNMCGDFTNDDQEEYVHEDYGNIMAALDEKEISKEEQEKYDEARRVW
jgi:hypothetical protein